MKLPVQIVKGGTIEDALRDQGWYCGSIPMVDFDGLGSSISAKIGG